MRIFQVSVRPAALAVASLSALSIACASSDASQPATNVLLSETFDRGGFTSRGWYDISEDFATSAVPAHAGGGARALLWHWAPGGATPVGTVAGRHLFTPTDRVYLRYWVKYSDNWVGSGQSAHPHELMLLTTEDDKFVGPAFTHLTAYVEHNWRPIGGVPIVSLQDGRNVDRTKLNSSLVGVTENRAAHGCNGIADAFTAAVTCYAVNATTQFNGRSFGDGIGVLWNNNATETAYKGNWHLVEAYFQLNTVRNGVGVPDGVIRYWFDSRVIMDLSGVLMRTGQYPNMMFNQVMFGPFMGNGSPVDQSAWIDDLIVARERVK